MGVLVILIGHTYPKDKISSYLLVNVMFSINETYIGIMGICDS